MSEEQNAVYTIPHNFDDTLISSWGIRQRNLIEALVGLSIVTLILFLVPMVFKVKIIIFILTALPWSLLSVKGINNCSITEYCGNMINYSLSQKVLKTRPLFRK